VIYYDKQIKTWRDSSLNDFWLQPLGAKWQLVHRYTIEGFPNHQEFETEQEGIEATVKFLVRRELERLLGTWNDRKQVYAP
jgi:hypothetical protein